MDTYSRIERPAAFDIKGMRREKVGQQGLDLIVVFDAVEVEQRGTLRLTRRRAGGSSIRQR